MNDTIAAISTPAGRGGIAVIRISGPDAVSFTDKIWKGKNLRDVASHSAHLGHIIDCQGNILDQAVATVFRTPKSFTGEDVVELSVHGSTYIQSALLESLINQGVRIAEPGEFTRRAFLNGKLDLAEAEAVADIIASSSRAAHAIAASQLQGRFSSHINSLRQKLIDLAALLELELDFSEEDVTFADRSQLKSLAREILSFIDSLASTFSSGKAIREGVPVAIIGKPNAGKSSLLNSLLGTDRAIVSDIPGTTRDTIEDTLDIDGITFRFIDTAGLRSTDDPIESLGIERSYASIRKAKIILWLIDPNTSDVDAAKAEDLISREVTSDSFLIKIQSKSDISRNSSHSELLPISSKTGSGIDQLRKILIAKVTSGLPTDESLIVTNARHQSALLQARKALADLLYGMNDLTTDLLAEHLREAISSLGSITGQITSTTILHTIFSRFCIGK